MFQSTMPTQAVLCHSAGSTVRPTGSDTFWQLVAPMTSELGTGLSVNGYANEGHLAGFGIAAGADIAPTVAAPFAATRPSAVIPSMTQAPRDARVDARVAVKAAKLARPPRGVPR